MIAAGHPRDQAVAAALRSAGRASGGPAPTMPTLATAAPNVNPSGFVPVPGQTGPAIDANTGALNQATQMYLLGYGNRGLPSAAAANKTVQDFLVATGQAQPSQAASAAAAPPAAPVNDTPIVYDTTGNQTGNARGGVARAAGGMMSPSEATPWWSRREAGEMDHPAGLVGSSVPGRTDRIPMSVASGSYVLPADVVSGLGEGNTLAGAHTMEMAMSSGPGGVRLPTGPHHVPSMPHMPHLARGGVPREQGGVPVIVAGGEYILNPAQVRAVGGGDLKHGHEVLDRWVVERRKHFVKKTKALPGPVKS